MLLALVAATAAAALVIREGVALRQDLLRAQVEFDQALALSELVVNEPMSFRDAAAALAQTRTHLVAAEDALDSADARAARLAPLLSVGAHLPGPSKGLTEVRPLIRQAQELAHTGLALTEGFARLTERLDEQHESEPSAARFAAALTAAEPAFADALAAFDRALAIRRAIRDDRLQGPFSGGAAVLATFDRRAGALGQSIVLWASAPAAARAVLGMDGPRTYAILGQNAAELRPTGGFIGSMGVVTVDRGVIIGEDYRSSYSFDNPERGWGILPAPMQAHLGPGALAVRDANWSPDFPTSAHWVETFLLRHQDISVDGVIGFTTLAVDGLIAALGPLDVEGFDQPLTAENWYAAAEQRIYFQDGVTAQDGKEATLEPMLKAIVRRLQAASPDDLTNAMRALRQLVRRRELLLSFHDPQAATLARLLGADGHFAPPATGDVLALVDANLSYSKVGPYVDERILYEVWLSEHGMPVASRITVDYENRLTPEQAADPTRRIGGAEWDAAAQRLRPNRGVYGTYARLYVPAGSRLLDSDVHDPPVTVAADRGFMTLERYYSVPAGGRARFSYAYQIPPERNPPGQYHLHVVKQPGTRGHALELRVYLPAHLSATTNLSMVREGDALVYRGALTTSLDFRLWLAGTTSASR